MSERMGKKWEIMKREDKINFAIVREQLVIPGSLPSSCSHMEKKYNRQGRGMTLVVVLSMRAFQA